MLETLWRIIPLGIGAAFTPSLLGLQILATRGDRWIVRTLMVILGSGLAFGIACSVLYFGFAQLPTDPPRGPRILQGILLLLAAGVLVATTVWLFRPHPDLAKKSGDVLTRRLDKTHFVTFFSVAFVLSIKDITSFALLVPGLHDIATTDIHRLDKAILVGILFGLALSPTLLPPLWRAIRKQHAARLLNRVYDFTMRHQFQIVGVIAIVFAVYCLVMALGKSGLAVAPW